MLRKLPLSVEDYKVAITWAAQTALREVIGQMELANIPIDRAKMDDELQKIIDERTTPWGVTVQSSLWKFALWSSRRIWKILCLARRRPSTNDRRVSFWANLKNKMPSLFQKPHKPILTTPLPCTCAP